MAEFKSPEPGLVREERGVEQIRAGIDVSGPVSTGFYIGRAGRWSSTCARGPVRNHGEVDASGSRE